MGRGISCVCALLVILILYCNIGNATKIDLTFVIDTSTDGITAEQFNQVIDFVYNIISSLTIGENDTMIAVVTFNAVPATQIFFLNYTEKSNLLNAVNELKEINLTGIRKTEAVLNHLTDVIYVADRGMRVDSKLVVVLLIYGPSISPPQTIFATLGMHNILTIFVVGIGEFVSDSSQNFELPFIASDPDDDHLYLINEIEDLCQYVSDLAKKIDNNSDTTENYCSKTISISSITEVVTSSMDSMTSPSSTVTYVTERNTSNTMSETTNFQGTTTVEGATISQTVTNVGIVSPKTTQIFKTTTNEVSTSKTTSSKSVTTMDITTTFTATTTEDKKSYFTSSQTTSISSLTVDVTSTSDVTSGQTSSESTLTLNTVTVTEGTSNDKVISHSPEISSKQSSDTIAVLVVLIIMWLFVIPITITLRYLPKYRKKKRMKQLINVLVSNYPDIENGLGPSRPKYTEAPHSYKNGHTPTFQTFLKLSMMTNGVRTVSR